jgi:hypothetical protein
VQQVVSRQGKKISIKLPRNPTNPRGRFQLQALADKVRAQYKFVLGIRGDDTPEHAKYLSYLAAKEFYSVFKPVSFETFLEEMSRANCATTTKVSHFNRCLLHTVSILLQ